MILEQEENQQIESKVPQLWKVWTFCKRMQIKIDHAHVCQEKGKKSQVGDLKDDTLSVVSEECMMVAQDKENMDDKEHSTVILILYI